MQWARVYSAPPRPPVTDMSSSKFVLRRASTKNCVLEQQLEVADEREMDTFSSNGAHCLCETFVDHCVLFSALCHC